MHRSSGLRFLMDGEITQKSVTQFIADFKDNKLEPFLCISKAVVK